MTLRVGGLFDGAGLLAYGLHLAGLEHAWLCELDAFRQGLLRQRFPGVPVYPDVRAVGADAPRVDLIAGGFPCKGMSSAGKRSGFGHPETALWREMARVVRDLRPRYVLVENVSALLGMHDGECFGEVLGTLAALGYDTQWDCFPAAAFGAPHGRDRVFLTAFADADGAGRKSRRKPERAELERIGHLADEVRAEAPQDADDRAVESGRLGRRAGEGVEATASDAEGSGRRTGTGHAPDGGSEGRKGRHGADRAAAALADASDERRGEQQARHLDDIDGRPDFAGRGVAVEWGEYEPAIDRWASIIGRPAPEPLIRRVDDGNAVSVERSRLSALGDGVLVQAGWLCGRRILDHAELVT